MHIACKNDQPRTVLILLIPATSNAIVVERPHPLRPLQGGSSEAPASPMEAWQANASNTSLPPNHTHTHNRWAAPERRNQACVSQAGAEAHTTPQPSGLTRLWVPRMQQAGIINTIPGFHRRPAIKHSHVPWHCDAHRQNKSGTRYPNRSKRPSLTPHPSSQTQWVRRAPSLRR